MTTKNQLLFSTQELPTYLFFYFNSITNVFTFLVYRTNAGGGREGSEKKWMMENGGGGGERHSVSCECNMDKGANLGKHW